MIIFLRELKRNRKAFIIWTVALVLFNVMMMSFFRSITGDVQKLDELVKSYPEGILKIFGMDRLSMSDVLGYFGTEAYVIITLLGSIYAMLLGSGIISKEESDKTIEFLLAKPVTRTRIVTSKALCVLFYVITFNIIFSVSNFIMFEVVKTADYDLTGFLLVSIGPLLLSLTFAAIGLMISVFITKSKTVYPLSIGIVIGAYALNVIASISDKTEKLKYFTPFKYVESANLIIDKNIETVYLIIMACIIVFSTVATYVIYNKKDITV